MHRPGLPAAVLWDMDGTLVDTEPYWMAAEHELVGEHGGVWTDEDAAALVGNALEVSATIILERTGLPLTVSEVVQALLGRVVERVRAQVPWRPGARELLQGLVDTGVPSVLVTMSWRSLADTVVGRLPTGSFRGMVTGDQVRRGKPDPEPYLAAARLLDLPPAACVALEDSPAGVRSATAAGVPTLAIPHVVPVPEMAGAVQIRTLAGVGPADLLRLLDGARPGAPADLTGGR
ncbi:HAD family phosphatase [Intrasporangium sp.]|uniref:HAD family hydrolase n=1 Tax=Intrasporangium sp. TaxID=1925024 RepID=UPI0032220252